MMRSRPTARGSGSFSPSRRDPVRELVGTKCTPDAAPTASERTAPHESAADYPSLAMRLEGWGERATDPQTAARLLTEAAEAALLGSGDPVQAAQLVEKALQRQPHAQCLLDRLSQLLEHIGGREAHKRVLQRLLLRLENHPQRDPKWMARVAFRLGRLYEAPSDTDAKALLYYRKALDHDPRLLPALQATRRIYGDARAHRAVALLWQLEVAATAERKDRIELLLGLATHQDRKLGDLDGAILSLRRALRLDAKQVLTMLRLARLLLARYRERRDPADAHRAAAVYLELSHMTAGPRARKFLQQCLALDPDNPAAQARRHELAGLRGEPAESPSNPQAPRHAHQDSQTPLVLGERGSRRVASGARPSVMAWLHSEALAPLPSGTQALEPPVPDPRPPPVLPRHCRIIERLPHEHQRETVVVNLGPSTGSHLYVGREGGLLEGGVFAATNRILPLEAKVALLMTFPGGHDAKALGRVHFVRGALHCQEDQDPGLAIEFEALTPGAFALVGTYAKAHPPMLYET